MSRAEVKEGLYDASDKNYTTRLHDQEEIQQFIDQIFGNNSKISFKEY